jgi:hypothetical protein
VLPGTSGDLVVTTTTLTLTIHMEVLVDHHMAKIIISKHSTMNHTVRHGTGLLLICIKMLHLIPPHLYHPQEIKILGLFYQAMVLMLMVGLGTV